MDTGIPIPDVPELADDDTEEARDELIELNDKIAYCLTFSEWIMEEIAGPCMVLKNSLDDILATEEPRIAASKAEQEALLATLKEIKDEANAESVEDFSSRMRAMFDAEVDYPVVSAEIEVLQVPIVC